MAFLALLGLLPLLVLAVTVIDVGIVTTDRLKRQTAADAAALAALQRQAVALNSVSISNVSMSYFYGEAVADEALIRALRDIVISYRTAIEACQLLGPSAAAACAALAAELEVVETFKAEADARLSSLCSFPRSGTYPQGGRLFQIMGALTRFEESLSDLSPMDQQSAEALAKSNGSQGAVVFSDLDNLGVARASLAELRDPTEHGSPDPTAARSRGFQRGYAPLFGLGEGEGPLDEPVSRNRRILMGAGPIMMTANLAIYAASVRRVLAQWSVASSDPGIPAPWLLLNVNGPDDVPGDRAIRQTLTVVWGERTKLLSERFVGSDDRDRLAYAQAEVYNATSWDLFTPDWRVRLVPAQLLEHERTPKHTVGNPPADGLDGLFKVPEESIKWLNAH